jgi:hypothetical protein
MRATAALAASLGFLLRLLFILRFPATGTGDAPFYIELAWNWVKKGVYGFPINGQLTPVDMRVPGYPAFLAAVFGIAGKSITAVMLCQALVDLATCFLVARIAATLAPGPYRNKVAFAALWLAVLCPFTANYNAVVLTETLVTFLTALALLILLQAEVGGDFDTGERAQGKLLGRYFLGGVIVGLGTLVRPETPLLLLAAGIVLLTRWWRPANWPKILRALAFMAAGLSLPLIPWAARNWHTLREVQFLAPHYNELPGEFAPLGLNRWVDTWLWRFRDVYLVTWKLDSEEISIDNLPASAFDSDEERARVVTVFEQYNNTLTWTRGEDHRLNEIASERTARFPLRTYLKIPLLRSLAIWFTPRVELLPLSGQLWPLSEKWEDDRQDLLATLALVSINCIYLVLALAGAWISRREPGWALLIAFILVRTMYFSAFADEAPEPRYVLECFPAIFALGAQVLRTRFNSLRWAPDELSTGKSAESVP